MPLLYGDLSSKVIQAFYQVHYELGHGFPESVYAQAMQFMLEELGVQVQREIPIKIFFRGRLVGLFRADSIAEGKIILEYKSGFREIEAAEAQLLNYLRSTHLEVGLLLNFAVKPRFRRLFMSNEGKGTRIPPLDSAYSASSALLTP